MPTGTAHGELDQLPLLPLLPPLAGTQGPDAEEEKSRTCPTFPAQPRAGPTHARAPEDSTVSHGHVEAKGGAGGSRQATGDSGRNLKIPSSWSAGEGEHRVGQGERGRTRGPTDSALFSLCHSVHHHPTCHSIPAGCCAAHSSHDREQCQTTAAAESAGLAARHRLHAQGVGVHEAEQAPLGPRAEHVAVQRVPQRTLPPLRGPPGGVQQATGT